MVTPSPDPTLPLVKGPTQPVACVSASTDSQIGLRPTAWVVSPHMSPFLSITMQRRWLSSQPHAQSCLPIFPCLLGPHTCLSLQISRLHRLLHVTSWLLGIDHSATQGSPEPHRGMVLVVSLAIHHAQPGSGSTNCPEVIQS